MSIFNSTGTSTAESFPYPPPSQSPSYHPLDGLFRSFTDPRLSTGARTLYGIMISMSWNKRYCWPSIARQAEYLGKSESSVQRYHAELESLGYLIVDRSGSFSNHYYPTVLSPQGRGDHLRPRPVRGTRTFIHEPAPRSPVNQGGVMYEPLTLKENFQKRCTNVPVPLHPWAEAERNQDSDQSNDRNVDKSWLQKEEVPGTADPAGEPEVHAPGDLTTRADAEITETQYSSVVSHDPSHATGAACTPGDPNIQASDSAKVQQISANPGDQARGEHFTRGKNISTPKTEKVEETSAHCDDHNRGDRVDSPVHALDEHGSGARTRKLFDTELLREVLDLTGDHKSKGCWISCVSRLPEEEIRIAMSSLRQAMMETDVYRPGGYMLGIIKSRNPDFTFAGRGKRKHHGQDHDEHRVPPTDETPRGTRTPDHVRVPVVPPAPPEPPQPCLEDQIKGWRFAVGSLGMPRALEIIQRCVQDHDLDVKALWGQIKDLLPGHHEKDLIERFFQTLKVRLQHSASQTAVT